MKEKTCYCPYCQSAEIVKNGLTRHGKQNHKCRVCGRQFSGRGVAPCEPPSEPVLLDRLLQERLSMRSISRIMQTSLGTTYNRIMAVLNPLGDKSN